MPAARPEILNPEPDTLPFEDALRELDAVVAALEAGQVSLEVSLQLLQRGMALAARCDATLDSAEATLEQLVATADGELVARRVDWNDNEDDDAADTDEDSNDG